ncbi:MAG: DUF433 domain-containing protein [Ignavibacteriae bacterium]|nr:DUF433 domain-containing protein [Ignavibacteriota bacterium]
MKNMMYHDKIEINPLICSGKPVIKNTRILVSDLLSQFAQGETFESLKRGYPGLTDNDIQAAIEFAVDTLNNVEVAELQ